MFAVERIEAGESVAIKAGHIVDTEEVLRLTEQLGDFSLQIDDDVFLTPRHPDEYDDLVVHISHSCDANVGFSGQVTYVAMRAVEAGEELCHDYAMARTAAYSMECFCRAADCRGTVTHDDWKLPSVQTRYAGWFMPHVQRRIDAQS